jgi:hypothetical protein
MLMHEQPIFVIAQSRIEAMNQGFRTQQSGGGYAVVIMIAAIAVAFGLAALIYLYFKRYSKQTVNDPQKLFAELCKAHGFSRSQRRLMRELAEHHHLKDPNMLLLESGKWGIGDTDNKRLALPKNQNRLLILKRQLFTPPQSPTAT